MGGKAIWQDYHTAYCKFWIATPDLEEMTVVATHINQIDSVKSDSIGILLYL